MAAPDFLGFGIITPFQRGPADWIAGGDVELMNSMIGQVLNTRSDSDVTNGELPWRTEFGSVLHHLRHRNNDQATTELARIYVIDALAKWIPQIRIRDVEFESKAGPNQTIETNVLSIRIIYDIISIRQAGNAVAVPNVTQLFDI